jgi:hypothetical protein
VLLLWAVAGLDVAIVVSLVVGGIAWLAVRRLRPGESPAPESPAPESPAPE